MMNQRFRRDDGFTLIELLMAITISGILISAVVTGAVATMRGSEGVHERYVQSLDSQFVATYFTSDVQSARSDLVEYGDPATPTGCDDASPTGQNVVRMQWTEVINGTTTAFSASYRLQLTSGQWQLARHYCTGPVTGGDIATSLASRPATVDIVARDLRDPADEDPEVVPDSATSSLTMTLYSALVSDFAPYSFSFKGTMRTPIGSTPPPPGPAFLVTASTGTPAADQAFNLTIQATSDGATVDTSYTGTKSLVFSGPANSPNGTAPTYPATATSVTFVAGEATATGIRLYKAETVSLVVTEGTRSGNAPVAVGPATMALKFSTCPPDIRKNRDTDQTITAADAYGNANSTSINVSLGTTSGGVWNPASVTVPAGGSIVANHDNPNVTGAVITLTGTGTAAGVTSATCPPYTTTNN